MFVLRDFEDLDGDFDRLTLLFSELDGGSLDAIVGSLNETCSVQSVLSLIRLFIFGGSGVSIGHRRNLWRLATLIPLGVPDQYILSYVNTISNDFYFAGAADGIRTLISPALRAIGPRVARIAEEYSIRVILGLIDEAKAEGFVPEIWEWDYPGTG